MEVKVMLVNGSPHQKGCTYMALKETAKALEEEGVETEIFWIENKPLSGCIACGRCSKDGKCALGGSINRFLEKAAEFDGFIFGSPVHYAAMCGGMTSFMDRAFFADLCGGRNSFYLKPAAAVTSARRAGTTATLDQMNKYFSLAQMIQIPSGYWNMVHGAQPEEVSQDEEGLQIMRSLGRNMAWFLRCREAGEKLAVQLPKQEPRVHTNFIR